MKYILLVLLIASCSKEVVHISTPIVFTQTTKEVFRLRYIETGEGSYPNLFKGMSSDTG